MDFLPGREGAFAPLRSRGELPHLHKPGGTYFVTFRLWDAVIPQEERTPRPTKPPALPADASPIEIVGAYDPPIRFGSCALADERVARLVENAMLHFNGDRYDLVAWCVMPNHVHAVLAPFGAHTPGSILHSWKSYTANGANRLLGRSGTFWERESFDHLVRSFESLERFVEYVEDNPVVAGLCQRREDWQFSSARRRLRGGS